MKILAIDIGGSRIKMGVVADGVVLARKICAAIPNNMTENLQQIAQQAMELPLTGVTGIGLAFPGIVNSRENRILVSNGKYPDAAVINYEEWAQETFQLPLRVTNDARAALMGEMAYGAGKGYANAVCMIIGTGVGTAVCVEGRMMHGMHGTLGNLGGHIAVQFQAPRRCTCGNRGCLEAYAGTWALSQMAQEDPRFAVSLLRQQEQIDYRSVFACTQQKDMLAEELFASACRALGAGAVNLVHAYDPEIVLISGGPAHIPAITERIREYVEQYAWAPAGAPQVACVEDPEASVMLGLASLWIKGETGYGKKE